MFKRSLALAIGVSVMGAASVDAANLDYGNVLTIAAGVPVFDGNGYQLGISSGSYFGVETMPTHRPGLHGDASSAPLSMGTTGLVIGVTTVPGPSHSGCPVAGESNPIDAPWCYFGNTGSVYIDSIPVIGGTATGLDMRGWSVTWNGSTVPFLSGVTWGAGYSYGIGNFAWDGAYGHPYTLDYHASFCPDPSGFCDGGNYEVHLEGVVLVPEASSLGMMLVGLGMLGYAARRRRNCGSPGRITFRQRSC